MAKQQQTRPRARSNSRAKQDQIGKGKVTPVQVAFIVDRYLSDNNFTQARSVFRTEASSLISSSPSREAPKSLLTLGAMLDEYISLKEQKVMLDQEKARVDRERLRIHNFLLGMQGVMNVYSGGGGVGGGGTVQTSSPFIPPSAAAAMPSSIPILSRPISPRVESPASGCPVNNTPTGSMPSTSTMEVSNVTNPVSSQPCTNNRKRSKASVSNFGAKKSRNQSTATQMSNQDISRGLPHSELVGNGLQITGEFSVLQSSAQSDLGSKSLAQGSGVADTLLAQFLTPVPSSIPTTPPQASSSQSEKFVSPSESCSTAKSNENNGSQHIASCDHNSKFLSETTLASPSRQVDEFSPGKYHYVSSSSPMNTDMQKSCKRDHVKGRLDFGVSDVSVTLEQRITDESSPSESEGDMGLYDADLPNLDDFGPDFFVSELLADFNIDCEAIGFACKPASGSSVNSVPKPADESRDGVAAANKVFSELTEILSEKDMNLQDQAVLASPKSTTRAINIQSPATSLRSSVLDQENLCTT